MLIVSYSGIFGEIYFRSRSEGVIELQTPKEGELSRVQTRERRCAGGSHASRCASFNPDPTIGSAPGIHRARALVSISTAESRFKQTGEIYESEVAL